MRNRKKSWVENELKNNKFIIKNPENFKSRWNDYFRNKNPIHLEIGCGKGSFIIKLSEINKDINFISLERSDQIIVEGARKVREYVEDGKIIKNLVFIIGDAYNLESYFSKNEIARIYINFCDPWRNKKKWRKRRLTYKTFLNIYSNLLNENGEIHFKTDDLTLFEFSLNEFCNENWSLKNISLDLKNSNFKENIITEYEQKFSLKGMKIYRLEAYKKKIYKWIYL